MKRSVPRRLGALAALVLALASAPAALAGTVVEHLTDTGAAIRLGFGVSPLRWDVAPAAAAGPGVESSENSTVMSFDLHLRWPGAATTNALEPYLVLGPALFVVEPDPSERLLGTRVDPTLQLGAKAGAGLNWRLGKRATLFGAYELTTAGSDGFASPGAKAPAGGGISGYDFTYGLRLRY